MKEIGTLASWLKEVIFLISLLLLDLFLFSQQCFLYDIVALTHSAALKSVPNIHPVCKERRGNSIYIAHLSKKAIQIASHETIKNIKT